mgnify:CR=1 FL=1
MAFFQILAASTELSEDGTCCIKTPLRRGATATAFKGATIDEGWAAATLSEAGVGAGVAAAGELAAAAASCWLYQSPAAGIPALYAAALTSGEPASIA